MSESTSLMVTASEWTEIAPNGTEIVLQNEGTRSIRVHISDTAPSDALLDTDGVSLAAEGPPTTFALEEGDSVWVRVASTHGSRKSQVNVWQEAAA